MKTPTIDELPVIGQIKHLFLSATVKCYRTEHLLSLYIDGQLSEKLTKEVELHLSECQSCRAAQTILMAAHSALSARQEIQPPAYLSEKLRQALAIEMSRPVPIKGAAPWIKSRLAVGSAGFAAVAAVAVFALLPRPVATTVHPVRTTPVSIATGGSKAPLPKLNSNPAHASKVMVALKPGGSTEVVNPIRRTIPSRISSDNLVNEPNNQFPIKAPTLISVTHNKQSAPGHKTPSKTVSSAPMIASNLSKTEPTTPVINPVVPVAPTAPVQTEQQTSTQVADNTEQIQHASLLSALRAHVQPGLLAGRGISTDEPIEQSAVLSGVARVASYTTPGVSFVGHDIR